MLITHIQITTPMIAVIMYEVDVFRKERNINNLNRDALVNSVLCAVGYYERI